MSPDAIGKCPVCQNPVFNGQELIYKKEQFHTRYAHRTCAEGIAGEINRPTDNFDWFWSAFLCGEENVEADQ